MNDKDAVCTACMELREDTGGHHTGVQVVAGPFDHQAVLLHEVTEGRLPVIDEEGEELRVHVKKEKEE